MEKIQIVIPSGMFGPSPDDSALDWALREIGKAFSSDPEGEWAEKYGTDVDNETFLMHHYCWCEKEGECPWCTGCGVYQPDCQACREGRFPHAESCYQTELSQRKEQFRARHNLTNYYDADYSVRSRFEELLYADLCSKYRVGAYGCAVHCTCGADSSREHARKTEGCDYSLGTGIFGRFKPFVLDDSRGYYDPPNFWHKPSNFRVQWYKYIGRETKINREISPQELQEIFDDCMRAKG